jgi:hypothetical protein
VGAVRPTNVLDLEPEPEEWSWVGGESRRTWRAVACAALPSPSARQIYAVRELLAILLMLWSLISYP